ncbi:MAG TPA: FtsX-like permease family protein [Acidimicrobiales bacterium]|nr:FtsX-like permease family protein [Acidimicrobiales bacterium]
MTTALAERPLDVRTGNGGLPARRAVVRWAWRLFRREWRQQLLVLALLVAAVAAATLGEAFGSSASGTLDGTFGTANYLARMPGTSPAIAQNVDAARQYFGTIDVITRQRVPVPGSVSTVELRAQDPNGPYSRSMVKLVSGRYPTAPDEVAVTDRVARIFDLHVGGEWREGGRTLQVVGRVENPSDLLDRFGLVAPGQADPPADVSILFRASMSKFQAFHFPSGPVGIEGRGTSEKTAAAVMVLILATVGLLFVGLVAVAGFTVMAQRRLRALGMLRSLGATDRHIRLVMLANGAAVGAAAAVVGTAAGLAGWFALAPAMEGVIDRRIDPFALPWWAIGAAMVLAVVTSVAAAWWPARAAARVPVVVALSGRPPRPRPARHFAALGIVLFAAGPVLLSYAHQRRTFFILGGIVATTFGMLLLAPLGIRALAVAGRRAPIGVRLALRDLVRYQARSGAALGAVTLAVGIAAAVAVSATAGRVSDDEKTGGNLPANQLVVHLGPDGGPVLVNQTPAQLQAEQAAVDAMAASLHARAVVPLEAAFNPATPDAPGLRPGGPSGPGAKESAALVKPEPEAGGHTAYGFVGRLYVATPAVLAHYGIDPATIDPTADVIASRDLIGLQVASGGRQIVTPTVQRLPLPTYSSAPNALLTQHGLQKLGLQTVRVGWLVETPSALTAAQVDSAGKAADVAGLSVETRPTEASLSRLRNIATAAGVLVAMAVLAMTVGLIRSETAGDLRILSAAGASSTTRRTLTGVTAGALAFLGAVLGTAGAYAALLAWYHRHLHPLTQPPTLDLVVILIGLPLVAAAAGWLLAGRQPAVIARQPLE